MSYVPQIDESVCAAHGDCAVVAADVFRVDEVAEVIRTPFLHAFRIGPWLCGATGPAIRSALRRGTRLRVTRTSFVG